MDKPSNITWPKYILGMCLMWGIIMPLGLFTCIIEELGEFMQEYGAKFRVWLEDDLAKRIGEMLMTEPKEDSHDKA